MGNIQSCEQHPKVEHEHPKNISKTAAVLVQSNRAQKLRSN